MIGVVNHKTTKMIIDVKGGQGSGHHGHRGRPGKIGGSLPGSITSVGVRKAISGFIEYAHRVYPTTEVGFILNPDGQRFSDAYNTIYTDNAPDSISFTEDEQRLLKGNLFIYNHPRHSGLSMEDVNFAVETGMKTIIATGGRGASVMYLLRRIDYNSAEFSRIRHTIERANYDVRTEFTKHIKEGIKNPVEAHLAHHDELWYRVAREHPDVFTYERIPFKELKQ